MTLGTWEENKHLMTSEEYSRKVREEEWRDYEYRRRQLKPTPEERAADEAARAQEAARREALQNFNSFLKGDTTMTTNIDNDRQQEIINKYAEALRAELALEDAKSLAQKNYEAADQTLLQYGEEYTILSRNFSQNRPRLEELENLMKAQEKIQTDSRREIELAEQAQRDRAAEEEGEKYLREAQAAQSPSMPNQAYGHK